MNEDKIKDDLYNKGINAFERHEFYEARPHSH